RKGRSDGLGGVVTYARGRSADSIGARVHHGRAAYQTSSRSLDGQRRRPAVTLGTRRVPTADGFRNRSHGIGLWLCCVRGNTAQPRDGGLPMGALGAGGIHVEVGVFGARLVAGGRRHASRARAITRRGAFGTAAVVQPRFV